MAKKAFLTFHYKDDCWRVSQIKAVGNVEEQPILEPNEWEEVEKGGDAGIQKWIDGQMEDKDCQVVLIGSKTAGRKWVDYEIKKAWKDKKGVFGVYIHNMKDSGGNQSAKGSNPFAGFKVGETNMSQLVTCYDPPHTDSKKVYDYIASNLESWITAAVKART